MFCLFENWTNTTNCIWLDTEEDGKLQIWPCRQSKRKVIFSWIFTVLTVGFVRLIFYWKPLWYVLCNCDYSDPENAQLIMVKHNEEYNIRLVRVAKWTDRLSLFCPGGTTIEVPSCRYFTYKKLIFVWHPMVKMFHKLFGLDSSAPLTLLASQKGLTSSEANKRLAIFGTNEIAVELKPIMVLLFREAFSPFYVFQVFSVCVWYSESYSYYATIIIVVSVLSIAINVWQTRRNQSKLRRMMYHIGVATVWRDGEWKTKSSTILVPGDVIQVPDSDQMQCDAVLLKGAVVVNEAMLTGESVPTTKSPLRPEPGQPEEIYDSKEHAKNTLFCGTKILQTKHASGEPVTAVVIGTGFGTTKGRLVRSIMYPKPIEFEFTRDLFRFISVFFVIAIAGFIYTIVLMVRRGNGFSRIATRSLDVITIVVPPALPAVITIGIIAAQSRLKKALIYCTSPNCINTAGGINVACFDKTGTLTEDGMDLFGVVPANEMETEEAIVSISDLPNDSEMLYVMASCHSLTRLNGELVGDPMDIVLFEKTNWKLEDSGRRGSGVSGSADRMLIHSPNGRSNIRVLGEYAFTSSLRRISVLAQLDHSKSTGLYIFCKGAPETVVALCSQNSIPPNFVNILGIYTKSGFRVIALASKRLDEKGNEVENILRLPRQELENEMIFQGLVLFENRLKPQTVGNINILKDANLRTVMVTGDNILTAVSVAKECGMLDNQIPLYTVEAVEMGNRAKITLKMETTGVDENLDNVKRRRSKMDNDLRKRSSMIEVDDGKVAEMVEEAKKKEKGHRAQYQLAITGSSYATIVSKMPEVLPGLTAVCDVYARMAPEQKVQLITNLQSLDYVVSMCGDGANDCGALKAAHVGCSLSQAEASIASPFTSRVEDISCVPTLIREGRASLVGTFGLIEYMCCYSITQFLAVSILYWIGTNLADFQFLYSDLILTTSFGIFFGNTRPTYTLSSHSPPTRILTLGSVTSIATQIALVFLFQMFAFHFVQYQPWFVPYTFPGDENNYISYQTTCVFFTASFQQIVLCLIYSKARPYRLPIITNYLLTIVLLVTTLVTLILLFCPGRVLVWFLDMKMPPNMKYRALIVVLALLHLFLAIGLEKCVEYAVPKLETYSPFKRKKPKYQELLASEIARHPGWLHANIINNDDAPVDSPNGFAYGNPAFHVTDEL